MKAEKTKISIITINYNNSVGLHQTIASVIGQTYTNIEYIVIDGDSDDESLSVIKKHEDKLAFWLSEKDHGIYHAMNKGIVKATGDYILCLNSGDSLIDKQIIENVVAKGLTSDLEYGDLQFFNHEKTWIWKLPSALTFNTFYTSTIAHPSTFIKKSLFEKVGLYDETLRIVSDWKFFMLAVAKFNCSHKHLDLIITAYNFDGISSRPENLNAINEERKLVLGKEFPALMADYEELVFLKLEAKKMRNWIGAGKFVKKLF